ncbi:MAG: DUF4097 family beta strand repeat-containing protein [Defluviitaleaceae bacterium]|nr:DUF4097 family beta strand repeat-containing protein [Defluviitaleaceae bacterium]
MNKEKMTILKMLEEGKITSADAARLLASADGVPPSSSGGTRYHSSASSSMPASHSSAPQPNRPPTGIPHAPAAPAAPKESMADEISRKFGEFAEKAKPKLHRFTEVVVEKTASAADSISKSLAPKPAPTSYSHTPATPASKPFGTPPFGGAPGHTAPSAAGRGTEEAIEIPVARAGSELNLTGYNGQVIIKGYNGDKISAKIFTVTKRPGARATLAVLGDKYYLSYDENDFDRVCIDAFVPETMFDNIRISTVNGDVRVATLDAQNIKIENLNGTSEISQLKAENIIIEQNNGALRISEISADMAAIENFSGLISASSIDVAKLKMATFNGAIDMQIAQFNHFNHYDWRIETSNEKLGLALPSYASLGYHVKAHAALGTVKLGLIGMNYIRNDKSLVEAKSIKYDESVKKVDLNLETSNAPLIIN